MFLFFQKKIYELQNKFFFEVAYPCFKNITILFHKFQVFSSCKEKYKTHPFHISGSGRRQYMSHLFDYIIISHNVWYLDNGLSSLLLYLSPRLTSVAAPRRTSCDHHQGAGPLSPPARRHQTHGPTSNTATTCTMPTSLETLFLAYITLSSAFEH